MPRIHDLYADCVVYVYPSIADAKSGERVGGSGFIAVVPYTNNPGWCEAYVVTNRHVVQAARTPVIRVNRRDGAVEYFQTKLDQWRFHPDGDDIAIFEFQVDVPGELRTFYVNIGDFLTPALVVKQDVGIGDDTFMLGRFINHEGRQQNTPAIRFGNIAMMPIEKIVAENGLQQESFLVETRSLPGYSGSPVFLYSINAMSDYSKRDLDAEEEEIRRAERERTGRENFPLDPGFLAHLKPKGPYLLGIDWCHLNTTERVLEKNGDNVPNGWIVRTNAGMAGVIPAWKIAELLNEEELVKMRRIEDEKLTQKANDSTTQEA
jgi:hypothetical protein